MVVVRHLGFSYFRNICQKFKSAPISPSTAKFGEARTIRGRVIAYFRLQKRRLPSWIWYYVTADHPPLDFECPNIQHCPKTAG